MSDQRITGYFIMRRTT